MSNARGPRDPRTPSSRGSARPASRRSGGRPGVRSMTGAAGSVRRAPAHVRRLLALALLVVLMGAVVYPVLSGYLRQRADITAAEERIADERAEISRLETELKKWDDDAYVEQQARQRLRFVKQGETAFTVIDDRDEVYTEALPGMAPVSEEVLAESPWYGQVWESVKIANEGLPETKEP
ncbi:FtsB family cell division protein [Ornithinimicrobium panacihumi]|uniref:FtsB family cell division protein n=1 Tax=Ornithinimicrobium panacihumi TaxID=2008449 RepID=UPI003F8BFD73